MGCSPELWGHLCFPALWWDPTLIPTTVEDHGTLGCCFSNGGMGGGPAGVTGHPRAVARDPRVPTPHPARFPGS